jgi:hypothetical protein
MTDSERVGLNHGPALKFIYRDSHVGHFRMGLTAYAARAHRESRLWCRFVQL